MGFGIGDDAAGEGDGEGGCSGSRGREDCCWFGCIWVMVERIDAIWSLS